MLPTGIERMRIIECLAIFQKACEERGVKFGRYTEDELLEILMLYKQYVTGEKPDF
jgi:hypothetical protein